ncbi:MAG: tRNA (cytidine(34)-2'-O)-methyltransferase [Candidatus Syntrophosphaera sp.]|nr:tRNA (cytidine(34)-2'-O)-methyltransferase [Candidatus Syntrophosphaera sp.]
MIPLPATGFNIALYEPEIPANTGNIGRLCVGTGSTLHIIQPCKFLLTDKALKRAGLDYWPDLDLVLHKNAEEFFAALNPSRIFLCTTKAERSYLDLSYAAGDAFLFGPESRGLPQSFLDRYPDRLITIPMHAKIRSLNLANSVSIVLFEAIRQLRPETG